MKEVIEVIRFTLALPFILSAVAIMAVGCLIEEGPKAALKFLDEVFE